MTNNFYMMAEMATSMNSDRRREASSYRLWKKALKTAPKPTKRGKPVA